MNLTAPLAGDWVGEMVLSIVIDLVRCLTSVAVAWGPSPSQQTEGIKKKFEGVLHRKTAFIWVTLPGRKGLRKA